MASQHERSQATREALIGAGLELFSERGYADVSVAELARRAGVSTGALYHQFDGKPVLFKAVYDELVQATAARIARAREASGEPSLIFDCEVYLDACVEPRFHRITADGPAVIGWDQILDDTEALIEASLVAAREHGEIDEAPNPSLARMLAAALKEAGVMIATAEDPVAARAQASTSARQLIGGLLAAGP